MHTVLYIVLCATTFARAGSAEAACGTALSADCNPPVIQEAYATGPHNIYVEWIDLFGTPDNTYSLEVTISGAPPTGDPTYAGIDQSEFVIDNLLQGTLYDVYVRTECPGETSDWYGPVSASTDVINGEACQISLPISDNNCPSMQEFPVHVNLDGTWILGADVFLKYVEVVIEHPWLADLSLTLISPSGVEIDLSSDNGVGDQNFGNPSDGGCDTTLQFADFACISVTEIEDDFTGQARPEQPLATVHDSTPAAGVWTLRICDKATDDIGTLHYVYLAFGTDGCTLPPELSVVNESNTSAEVSISTISACDSVEIAYGPAGTIPGVDAMSMTVACGDSLAMLTGLEGGAEYVVFGRARCNGDSSQWTCAKAFTTACQAPTLYSAFDNAAVCSPSCAEPCTFSDTVWQNVSGDSTDWIVFAGSTPTEFTGPSDTRNGVGNYLYMETSGLNCGDTTVAILRSACLDIQMTDGGCDLGFWYHMYGAGIGTLRLESSTDGGFTWQSRWERQGDQGNAWRFALIDLQSMHGELAAFRFVATREANFFSDFAVDDITFYGSTLADSASMRFFQDQDQDSFGNGEIPVCYCTRTPPAGTSENDLDCDDNNPAVNPGVANEVPCNLIDDNCNGQIDEGDINPLDINIVSVVDASCSGIADGAIDIMAVSGAPPYTYTWNTGDTTHSIDQLAPGSYQATITDFNGCVEETGIIDIDASEVLHFVLTDLNWPSCPGISDGSIAGAIQGGQAPYTYAWSNGDTTSQAMSVGNGSYTVTITDANGCYTVSDTILVAADPAFQVSIIQMEHVDCHGDSSGKIRIQASNAPPPVTYTWSNGDTSALADELTAGHYACTVTDANGCEFVLSDIVISEPDEISITLDAVDPPVCADEQAGTIQITATGGTLPYFFQWSNGMFSEDLYDIPSGSYSVSVTDFNECQSVFSGITLISPSSLEVSEDTIFHPRCPAGTDGVITVRTAGGSPPYIYQWSNGDTTPDTLRDILPGNYALTVSDAFGCKDIIRNLTLEPMITPLQIEEVILRNVDCHGDSSGVVGVEVIGGTPTFEFNWSIGIKHFSSGADSITGLPAGEYSVTVTDAQGCIGTWGTVTLVQPAPLGFHLDSVVGVSCFGSSDGAVLLNASGGTPPYNYQWSNGQSTQDLTKADAGSYTVIIADSLGCMYTTPAFTIEQADTVRLVFETHSSTGAADGWAEVTADGASEPLSYLWDDQAGSQTTRRATDLIAGLYQVTVTGSDNCSFSDTVRVYLVNSTAFAPVHDYRVFPNPATDQFYLQGNSDTEEIALWDIAGRRTEISAKRMAAGTHICRVPSWLPDGIYWLQVNSVLTKERVVIARQ